MDFNSPFECLVPLMYKNGLLLTGLICINEFMTKNLPFKLASKTFYRLIFWFLWFIFCHISESYPLLSCYILFHPINLM